MAYNSLPPGYDTWKLAYPPAWDDEPEPFECLDCGHEWTGEEATCPHCGSTEIVSTSPEPPEDDD